MIRIRATVRRVTGSTKHYLGRIDDEGNPQPVAEFPPAQSVEIEESNEGYYLFYFDSEGKYLTNGWFPSMEEAKEQAKFEFLIEEGDWVAVNDD